VVHRDDAAELDARAGALLGRCGASVRQDALDAFDVVTPRCVERQCTAQVTTYHIDNP
jgi:hypothetical protein